MWDSEFMLFIAFIADADKVIPFQWMSFYTMAQQHYWWNLPFARPLYRQSYNQLVTSLSWLQLFLPEVAENNKTLSTSAVSLAVNIYEETWTFVFIKSIYSWSNKFELVHKIVLGAEQEAYLLLYTNWKEVFVKLSFENSTAIRRINILCVWYLWRETSLFYLNIILKVYMQNFLFVNLKQCNKCTNESSVIKHCSMFP